MVDECEGVNKLDTVFMVPEMVSNSVRVGKHPKE